MKKKVESFFKSNPGSAFKNKEIAKRLEIRDAEDYALLKKTLHKLLKDEFLFRKGKRYQINLLPDNNHLRGKFNIHPDGYGFVVPNRKKVIHIFIAERNIGTAFDGDIVEVVLFAKQKGKNLEGQITKVVERKRKEIIGTLQKSKSFYFITPDDLHFQRDIYIDESNLNDAKEGDKVIVGDILWDTSMLNPEGVVLEVLGKKGSKISEVLSITREYNIPYKFSSKVLKECEDIEIELSDAEIKRRADFRDDNIFTIDPVDAKDFDDALSVKILENGNLNIGVHIADVSHYVEKDSAPDIDAKLRGNSVYLVGEVVPMLPENLSNGICSLVPNKDRLTYSVIFELTKRGKVVSFEFVKSIINSKRRFTYEEVQEIIETGKGDFSDEIILLNNLAKAIRKKRIKEGSIEFHTPEVVFELDSDGKPINAVRKELKESNMLVEEFMLLANRTVARNFLWPNKSNGKSFIYRIHEKPDKDKIKEFARFVKTLGYSFNPDSFSDSKEIQRLINQVKNSEEDGVINELAIRSMAKAVYSIKNIGHFGLGFKHYTHFTSPIRRYSDLIVHRLVYSYSQKKTRTDYSLEQLREISDHVSGCERNAIEAERHSVKIKQVEYLQDKVGEIFHAVISGVTYYGIFVEITDILAEGLIRVRDLEGDFYVYDEKKYSLIGRYNKKRYRLGDKLLVKLVRADLGKYELDFIIVE
ncbi:MAG: ribonuclease R [Ignavibacterium sp.]|nr:MAG: ribonuclease R [Ignavibacterium sp.]